jgi:diguanylate cyclase (GGDEF)-like protein
MVIRFIRDKFIIVLKNIPTETNISLISFGMILFVTVTLLRFYFTVYANPYWTLIIIVLIAMIAITCYRLIYIIVDNTKRIDSLRQIAYSDYLTGVNNRLALFLDAEELILNRKPFYILYMDLDNFKNINDTYGHDIGDKYLKSFTKTTLEVIQDNGNFYRMSGDEFICIYYGSNIDIFIATFEDKIFNNFDTDISFLGVSIGYAKYPDDCETIDQLIKKADKIMYRVKKSKHKAAHTEDL